MPKGPDAGEGHAAADVRRRGAARIRATRAGAAGTRAGRPCRAGAGRPESRCRGCRCPECPCRGVPVPGVPEPSPGRRPTRRRGCRSRRPGCRNRHRCRPDPSRPIRRPSRCPYRGAGAGAGVAGTGVPAPGVPVPGVPVPGVPVPGRAGPRGARARRAGAARGGHGGAHQQRRGVGAARARSPSRYSWTVSTYRPSPSSMDGERLEVGRASRRCRGRTRPRRRRPWSAWCRRAYSSLSATAQISPLVLHAQADGDRVVAGDVLAGRRRCRASTTPAGAVIDVNV